MFIMIFSVREQNETILGRIYNVQEINYLFNSSTFINVYFLGMHAFRTADTSGISEDGIERD